jgi:hypothetical protein
VAPQRWARRQEGESVRRPRTKAGGKLQLAVVPVACVCKNQQKVFTKTVEFYKCTLHEETAAFVGWCEQQRGAGANMGAVLAV